MKNYTIICAISLLCSIGITAPAVSHKMLALIQSSEGLELEPASFEIVNNMIELIGKSSPADQRHVAQALVTTLQIQAERLQEEERALQAAGQKVPRSLYHRQFITASRIAHFKKIAGASNSWKDYVVDTFQSLYARALSAVSYLTGNSEPSPADQLLAATKAYLQLEDDEILFNQASVAHFAKLLQRNKIPSFVAVWADEDALQELLLRAQRIDDQPRIQMLKVAEMAGTMILFSAGSAAISEAEKDYQNKMSAFNTSMKDITANADKASKASQQKAETASKKIITDYISSMSSLQQEQQLTASLFAKEITYVNQSIVAFDKPLDFLNSFQSAIAYDMLFEQGAMLTPNNGLTWYNPFQLGDWQFDVATKSFWQNQFITMPTPLAWVDRTNGHDPARYSIFTEYIPPTQAAYTITIDMTLINCTWPFFAGVMFNKARWISGDPETETQYRLFGIYGTQSDPNNVATRKLSLVFAQQKITLGTDGSTPSKIISPLEQIMTDPATVLYTLDQSQVTKKDAQELTRNPQTYRFAITTLPDNINYAVQKILPSTTPAQIKTGTVNNLTLSIPNKETKEPNQYTLFNYHGIGCMAPGCQAQFTITTPTALTYTDEQLKAFTATLTNAIAQRNKES